MALFGGRSTYTNLLEAYSDGILILQDRNAVSAAHIDFSKAFDSVSHQKLFTRLYSHGIRTTSYSGYKTFFQVVLIRLELVIVYLYYWAMCSQGFVF